MAIKKSPQFPSPRAIGNILFLIGVGFLLLNLFLPGLLGPRIPQVPYSLFIHQVDEGK